MCYQNNKRALATDVLSQADCDQALSYRNPSLQARRRRCHFTKQRHNISWWRHQMETFSRYWPFVRGIHRFPVKSPHKGQWRGALIFYLIYVGINGWVNNGEAGDLRRYRAHYDVSVMSQQLFVLYRPSWGSDIAGSLSLWYKPRAELAKRITAAGILNVDLSGYVRIIYCTSYELRRTFRLSCVKLGSLPNY